MATLDNVQSELALRVGGVVTEDPSMWVNSAYRSTTEQTVMYGKWLFGVALYGREGALSRGYVLAAAPGKSKHNRKPAEAVDVGCPFGKSERRAQLFKHWGLHAPITGEPWHAELAPDRGPMPDDPTLNSSSTNNVAGFITENEGEDMPKYADEFTWPDGSQVQVFPDGRTECFLCPSYGSMFSLNPDEKKTFTNAHSVRPVNPTDSKAGYIVLDQGGNKYQFDQAFAESRKKK